ncbi:MAG TPA: DoxX family protein [Terriglobales bacterium]|nr:DoxX family protein [Terriglobales bacterium]
MRILDRFQFLGLLAMRIVLGTIMIAHGFPKVFGGGMHGTIQFISSLGLPWWSAYLSAYAEFFGGVLVLVGLFTRVAALALLIDMIVAILLVHLPHGLTGEGGYQFPLSLAALSFALLFLGPGPIALDRFVRFGGGRAKSAK